MSGIILEVKQERRVEIARSFAYKLNVAQYGGPQYESRESMVFRRFGLPRICWRRWN